MALHTKYIPAQDLGKNGNLYTPRDVVIFRQPTFSGPMRKHGSDKQQRKSGEMAVLDALAAVKAAPVNPLGYTVRKAR